MDLFLIILIVRCLLGYFSIFDLGLSRATVYHLLARQKSPLN